MKFLLVLSVIVVAIWLWRNNRQGDLDSTKRPPPKPTALPMAMVACLQCGTHLPESESVRGPGGRYCCDEHRQQHEHGTA
ncbi:hypothetical protein LPB72_02585 [Hydrogenophaga crassostreae]|uniref:MYND-type domain-containing protein n=1 Tax=Hydrogenophaga crassostreae TaxID=1763535 RepID=A0A170AGZ6_9BURK|nr:PP0621 family protein [Hydrogenophaga crassostreae]AOW11962.1 hypothetical protein LPB072_02885 [Hydrogenophaga crassostreae]OAD43908.1 hypothetical protein LPB72_02585 [Hydrogenophaga crassostreae]